MNGSVNEAARDAAWLQRKSIDYRRRVLEAIVRCGAGHTGGSLSCVDILNVLYNRILRVSPDTFAHNDRDRYIQSKGHSVESLYVILADRGFFPPERLLTMNRCGSCFIGHPSRDVPGIEQSTGALGHGLSLAVGCALAGKLDAADYRVFTLLGDGELAEGSCWEAMMAAGHYRLDNLVVIIDRNGLQITGRTEDVMALEPLAAKLEAFGLAVADVDGHDVEALASVLSDLPVAPGRPSCIIARTTKGKGVSFIENNPAWHHRVPDAAELQQALSELAAAEEACR